jgi:AcrR family transcriptional regulator
MSDISRIKVLSPGTAVHTKGQRKVLEILETATNLLAYEGYSKFTMRRVAEELGITLRNVQYYFNTKQNLFESVIELRLKKDIESAQKVIDEVGKSPEERFLAFVDYSLAENTTRFIRGLQFELWALSNHNEFAAKSRDYMTFEHCNFIYNLITPLTKNQSEQMRREKSVLLLAMLQGFPLIEGSDINIDFKLGNLKQLFRDEALNLVLS